MPTSPSSTPATLAGALYTAGLPDPDLIIRTAGEMRISNFMLWQAAYAEIYVTETLWPDFDAAAIEHAPGRVRRPRPPVRGRPRGRRAGGGGGRGAGLALSDASLPAPARGRP